MRARCSTSTSSRTHTASAPTRISIFVVAGATVHWAAVLVGVVLAPAAVGVG